MQSVGWPGSLMRGGFLSHSVTGSSSCWSGMWSTDRVQEPPACHPHQRRLPARRFWVTETQGPQCRVSRPGCPEPQFCVSVLVRTPQSSLGGAAVSLWHLGPIQPDQCSRLAECFKSRCVPVLPHLLIRELKLTWKSLAAHP